MKIFRIRQEPEPENFTSHADALDSDYRFFFDSDGILFMLISTGWVDDHGKFFEPNHSQVSYPVRSVVPQDRVELVVHH